MTRFLFAFLIPHLILASIAIYPQNDTQLTLAVAFPLLCIIAGIPFGAAWLSFELVTRLRPVRSFHHLASNPLPRFVSGFAAGLLSLSLSTLSIALFPHPASDPYVFAAAAVIATAFILCLLPRFVPSSCPSCGYDISHSPTRCPECGSTRLPPRVTPTAT